MRGGFVHNRVLVGRLEAAFRAAGAETLREYPTGPAAPRGFVDLYVTKNGVVVVCEAELRATRATLAVEKAMALDANVLLLVVPRQTVARATVARLGDHVREQHPAIFVLTLGAALQWVARCFPFLTARYPGVPERKAGPHVP